MERATRAPDDLHLRVVVERLAREGCSQREIEAVVARLTPPGREAPRSSLPADIRRFVST